MSYRLCKLSITGVLDKDTPLILIKELCKYYYIDYVEDYLTEQYIRVLIRQIETVVSPTINYPLTNDDIMKITRFVNPASTLRQDTLLQAFNFQRRFMGLLTERHAHCNLLDDNPQYGRPTEENPQTIPLEAMYRICKAHDVPLERETTFNQMVNIMSYLHTRDNYLRSDIINEIRFLDKTDLYKLYLHLNVRKDIVQVEDSMTRSYENMLDYYNKLNDKEYLRSNHNPANSLEAIVLAAVNHGIDISLSTSPLNEYKRLCYYGADYYPLDPILSQIYQRDKDAINLKITFNPRLPREFYNKNTLKRMLIDEGYTYSEIRNVDYYELLQTNYLSETFYHGHLKSITNRVTHVLMDNVDEISEDECVCYGVKDEMTTAYRYSELAATFSNYRKFINPASETELFFDERAIRKLKHLCKKIRVNDSASGLKARDMLSQAIKYVELVNDESRALIYNLYEYYHNGDANTKLRVVTALDKLFKLVLYMRGWNGHSEYPISSAPVEDQTLVDLNVTTAVADFEQYLNDNELDNMFLPLPLYRYHNGIFSVSSDINQGYTIGDRLYIVKNGDTIDPTYSCIRLSSNWLGATLYYLYDCLGLEAPFSIDELRQIS